MENQVNIIDIREHKLNQESLIDRVINGLNKPENGLKSIPTFLLYDDRGLQLFNSITNMKEYYITNAEIEILKDKIDDIVDYIKDDTAIIELGSGSLRKTKVILDSLEKKRKNITYYALDLMETELKKSLSSLGKYENIKLVGLWGTYENGIKFLSDNGNGHSNGNYGKISKVILWLGSSIGNYNREEGSDFIQRFQNQCMNPGDLFLIGIDRRNDPDKIQIAYRDPEGITEEFIINGLNHVNVILGQENFLDLNDFDYHSLYNESEGRHEAYYKSKKDMTLKYIPSSSSKNNHNHDKNEDEEREKEILINLKKDELIHIEYSYKYNESELTLLFHKARLSQIESWSDSQSQFGLHLLSKPPFYFGNSTVDPSRGIVPTLNEWIELWKSFDTITMSIVSPERSLEKPIHLRHPYIFYLGHIPTFLDIHLSKYFKEKYTEPKYFTTIFERGIDPHVDEPTKCNPHSITPDKWPELDSVIEFRNKVRKRLVSVYEKLREGKIIMERRLGRVLWMTFEHGAMHIETLLYMLIQSPLDFQVKGLVMPKWKEAIAPVPGAKLITVPKQTITLGNDDDDCKDYGDDQNNLSKAFGWDNESPRREINVESFKIHSRPVTNGEYLEFMKRTVNKEYPASWIPIDPPLFEYKVRTIIGGIEMNIAMNWPVILSQEQACKYAAWKKMRLPTEAELFTFHIIYKSSSLISNIGFKNWHPVDVPNNSNTIQTLGSGWEWTSSEYDKYPGFKPSELYPGYSVDFFDGKHVVLLGGSWATHPRLTRSTFRNWYQKNYPYVFAITRLCQDTNR